eukprot:11211334-Lingulodinium_polyedra.AAC.1
MRAGAIAQLSVNPPVWFGVGARPRRRLSLAWKGRVGFESRVRSTMRVLSMVFEAGVMACS